MSLRFAALAIGLTLCAPAAAARPAFTPPAAVGDTGSATCLVQNLGTKPRTVSAILRNQDGTEIDSGSIEVPPGAVRTLAGVTGEIAYCEFEGLNRIVRGFLQAFGDASTVVLPAGR